MDPASRISLPSIQAKKFGFRELSPFAGIDSLNADTRSNSLTDSGDEKSR